MKQVLFQNGEDDLNLANAMGRYQSMLDIIRDGEENGERGILPSDLNERRDHLKSFAYFNDATQAATCTLTSDMFLSQAIKNPESIALEQEVKEMGSKTLSPGVDLILADLKRHIQKPARSIENHSHAIVIAYEYPRDPEADEPGCEWLVETQAQRAALRAAECAVILADYIRLLGYEARGHTGSSSEVDLNKLVVASGIGEVMDTKQGAVICNPYLGTSFGVSVVTTTFQLGVDQALIPGKHRSLRQKISSHGPSWWFGRGMSKNIFNSKPYEKRRFKDGAYPFERSRRVEETTTFIDEMRVARVPKRTDMFARALFGDMGKKLQEGARNGNYVRKAAASFSYRRSLTAFSPLQLGKKAEHVNESAHDSKRNADNIKAALYYLGADAVGISRCPDWVYYSHDASGEEIVPYHNNAISVIIDQGHETTDASSGDDWISAAQSMRAYLRFSLLGGVIAEQIRKLGYSARVHTVLDGEVLQPPLLLLSGLGEVSRIGEVILNPYLGPRLKSGVITTDMPLVHDKPIDFGLQKFCSNCNKCARECPSGAITAGPKTMFNGYEIWKSDSQKCATYRITQAAGSMCGRCMKTCPWNLEGLFAEAPFRWLATNVPVASKALAELDDKLGNGRMNTVKKWWWDLEMSENGSYTIPKNTANARDLNKELKLKFEDQTLAVYPANLAPPPYPFPYPMDREKGIKAYQDMLSPDAYKARLEEGNTHGLAHSVPEQTGPVPVMQVLLSAVDRMSDNVTKYEFTSLDGDSLPDFSAGAHIDVMVSPEYFRQYSLSGDPADNSKYQIGVLREDQGRGGSMLLHKVFEAGRKVFISRPINHFPLDESAQRVFLMGGGIGVTPMIAMAHRLHKIGVDFEFHYSCSSRAGAGFMDDLALMPWKHHIKFHFSDEGSRADMPTIIGGYKDGYHLYTCGAERYMHAVLDAASLNSWPDEALHKEYFSVPDAPEYENTDFVIKIASTGVEIPVPADTIATDALLKAGYHVDVKCEDGICGVCKCSLISGEVEHRDFVLSNAQRKNNLILCQSRASTEGGVIEVDL